MIIGNIPIYAVIKLRLHLRNNIFLKNYLEWFALCFTISINIMPVKTNATEMISACVGWKPKIEYLLLTLNNSTVNLSNPVTIK